MYRSLVRFAESARKSLRQPPEKFGWESRVFTSAGVWAMNEGQRPLYIQVNPADNVAIIVNEGGLPAGSVFESGLKLLEDVPEAHKVALRDIERDQPIVRYGVVIGYALISIAKGSWIHEGNLRLPKPPELK